jgi:hypothetical protein
MEKEFVLYEQSLELKELGFNEPCFGWFRSTLIPSNFTEYFLDTEFGMNESPSDWVNSNFLDKACSAPLYQQAFRWFREKYNLDSFVKHLYKSTIKVGYYFGIDQYNGIEFQMGLDEYYKTYEEAELECLKKLIEIVKQQKEDESKITL